MSFLYAYLIGCLCIALYTISGFAHEDIFVGPGHKFGYNYQSAFSWFYLLFVSCPGLNIFTFLVYFVYCPIRNYLENRKNARTI